MANPVSPGTFETWVTDREWHESATPKSSDTGAFERWVTDREWLMVYTEAAAVGATLRRYSLPALGVG